MVSDFLVIIEKHENAHLVSRDRHLISLPIAANSCSYFCMPLIQFPVQLSPRELRHVILFKDTHTLFDLLRNLDNLNLLQWLILHRRVPALIGPMSRGQNFDIQINCNLLITRTFLEILHSLFGHLNVFEHYFESLRELETAFFFQLLDYFFFSIFQHSSLF